MIFAAGLLLVPLLDGWLGAWRDPWQAAVRGAERVGRVLGGNGPWTSRTFAANRAATAGIGEFESSLEDSSQLVAAVRPATLDALLRFGGAGSEEAYVGRDGWLFYRPDVDALVMSRSANSGTPAEGLAAGQGGHPSGATGVRRKFLHRAARPARYGGVFRGLGDCVATTSAGTRAVGGACSRGPRPGAVALVT
jgi:hypothetical protein